MPRTPSEMPPLDPNHREATCSGDACLSAVIDAFFRSVSDGYKKITPAWLEAEFHAIPVGNARAVAGLDWQIPHASCSITLHQGAVDAPWSARLTVCERPFPRDLSRRAQVRALVYLCHVL